MGKAFNYLQAGDYVYLHPRDLYEEFLNPFHKSIYPDKNLVEVLACSCGSIGCWSLLANVEYTMSEVIWNGFISPICEHVENLNVTFPTFKFSKGHYRSAIAQLKDISGINGELPKEVGFPEFSEPALISDRISKLRKKANHAWNEKLVVHDEIWRSKDLFLEIAKKVTIKDYCHDVYLVADFPEYFSICISTDLRQWNGNYRDAFAYCMIRRFFILQEAMPYQKLSSQKIWLDGDFSYMNNDYHFSGIHFIPRISKTIKIFDNETTDAKIFHRWLRDRSIFNADEQKANIQISTFIENGSFITLCWDMWRTFLFGEAMGKFVLIEMKSLL